MTPIGCMLQCAVLQSPGLGTAKALFPFSSSPVKTASSGVLGAISPMPLSSLAVTAKSVLQKRGLANQHRNKHTMQAGLLRDLLKAALTTAQFHVSEHIRKNHSTAEPRGNKAFWITFKICGGSSLSLACALTFCLHPEC